MLAPDPIAIATKHDVPRFIYITGCDGTGKTTQACLLLEQLQIQGIKTRHVWLRFPFFFSLPLLAFARLRGYSWYEETGGVRHGYWDFRGSWVMKNVFPWVLLLDATLAAFWKVYLPLWAGWTLVCERFVLDMLADLFVACDNMAIDQRSPGKLYIRLLPRSSNIIMLDLDMHTIQIRRNTMRLDNHLDVRLKAFKYLASSQSVQVLSSQANEAKVHQQILKMVGIIDETNG